MNHTERPCTNPDCDGIMTQDNSRRNPQLRERDYQNFWSCMKCPADYVQIGLLPEYLNISEKIDVVVGRNSLGLPHP